MEYFKKGILSIWAVFQHWSFCIQLENWHLWEIGHNWLLNQELYANANFKMWTCFTNNASSPPKKKNCSMWRPCNFTPLHSLTGPVGQPFASRLGSQCFASQGCTNLHWNRVFSVSAGSLLVTPKWFDPWLCRLSVGTSLCFAPTMWKCDNGLYLW